MQLEGGFAATAALPAEAMTIPPSKAATAVTSGAVPLRRIIPSLCRVVHGNGQAVPTRFYGIMYRRRSGLVNATRRILLKKPRPLDDPDGN
jgi:hypothetical protein